MSPGSGRCGLCGASLAHEPRGFQRCPGNNLRVACAMTGCLDFEPQSGPPTAPRAEVGRALQQFGARHAQCASQTGGFLGRQGPADAARRQLRDLGHRRRVLRRLAESRGGDGRRERDLGHRARQRLQSVAAQPAGAGRRPALARAGDPARRDAAGAAGPDRPTAARPARPRHGPRGDRCDAARAGDLGPDVPGGRKLRSRALRAAADGERPERGRLSGIAAPGRDAQRA